jgi:HPt (histidine-containing phosphotransfer) domain-containing protein
MYCLPQSETNTTEKLYDLKQLQEVLGGSTDILTSLAGIYVNTIPVNSKELIQASRAQDWTKVSKLAHKIKPTIDSMNIKCILVDIRTLEKDAKNQVNTHALTNIALKIDHVINTVAQQLRYEFNL